MALNQASLRKFSKSSSKPLPSQDSGSRLPQQRHPIPGPASPAQFFSLLVFSLLRKPMFVDPAIKAGVYLCTTAAASLLFDFIKVPPSYFSNKRNVVNMIFVKWGWAWTFFSLGSFIILSTYIYTGANKRLLRAHLMRLLVGSACWYVCTGVFGTIESSIGSCYNLNGTILKTPAMSFNRRSCRQLKGFWLGFDISGHCFLLTMCNLFILEELRIMRSWSVLGALLDVPTRSDEFDIDMAPPVSATNPHQIPNVSPEELLIMRSAYSRLTMNLRAVFSLTACLSLLWDFMLMVTVVYFHSMPTKLIGTCMGISCWLICYRFVFPSVKVGSLFGLAPGMPGDGPLHFVAKR